MAESKELLERVTRISFAEWAGDFGYALSLLREVYSDLAPEGSRNSASHPLSLIYQNIKPLGERLEHMQLLISDQRPHLFDKYPHVRGVVWRTGRNEFEMRAYLNDFSWEKEFYRRVEVQLENNEDEALDWPTGNKERSLTNHPETDKPIRARGGSWILDTGSFFREVVISDIGLIRVKGLWTKRQLPRKRTVVVRGFGRVLTALDNPE